MFRRFIRIKKISQVLILLLVFLFSAVPFLFADKLSDSSKKLKKVDHKLSEKKSEIKEITSKEKSTIELLDEIDKKLSLDKKNLTKLDLELRGLDKEIKIARKNLASSEQDLELYKRRLSRRVRAIYKFGRMNIFEIILTSDSTNEFLLKYKLLKIISIIDGFLSLLSIESM